MLFPKLSTVQHDALMELVHNAKKIDYRQLHYGLAWGDVTVYVPGQPTGETNSYGLPVAGPQTDLCQMPAAIWKSLLDHKFVYEDHATGAIDGLAFDYYDHFRRPYLIRKMIELWAGTWSEARTAFIAFIVAFILPAIFRAIQRLLFP